jgi:hypothetical protein
MSRYAGFELQLLPFVSPFPTHEPTGNVISFRRGNQRRSYNEMDLIQTKVC